MGILTQTVAADEHEAESIGESLDPKSEWSAVERRDIDIPKIATLISVLTGDLYDDAVVLCEPIYISPAEGAFVLHFSDIARERLAELEEEAIEVIALAIKELEQLEIEGRLERRLGRSERLREPLNLRRFLREIGGVLQRVLLLEVNTVDPLEHGGDLRQPQRHIVHFVLG